MAIFFGVAAALAGQAWFESQADRRAEREFLVTVEEELEIVEQFLNVQNSFLRERGDVASRIFSITSSLDPAPLSDSLVAATRRLSSYLHARPLEPLDDVLAPERLTAVDDPDLRRSLARFRSQVSSLRRVHEQNTSFVLSELRGFLHEHFGFCSDELPTEELIAHLPCGEPDEIDPTIVPELESYVHVLVLQCSNLLNGKAAVSDGLVEVRTEITARLAAL